MAKSKVDIEPADFKKMQLTHDIKPNRKTLAMGSLINIDEICGKIEKGMRRFGFTAGQFSLSDLIEYILYQTGPADIYISR